VVEASATISAAAPVNRRLPPSCWHIVIFITFSLGKVPLPSDASNLQAVYSIEVDEEKRRDGTVVEAAVVGAIEGGVALIGGGNRMAV
jgi:hypothetical protein